MSNEIRGGVFLIIRTITVIGTENNHILIVNFSSIANNSSFVSVFPEVVIEKLIIRKTNNVIRILGIVV